MHVDAPGERAPRAGLRTGRTPMDRTQRSPRCPRDVSRRHGRGRNARHAGRPAGNPGRERRCRPGVDSTRDRTAATGFTLLELLVVLVLVGLVTTLALPNLERLQGAVTAGTERDYILDQLAGLGREAMLRRRAYVVVGSGHAGDVGFPGRAGETAAAGTRGLPARPAGDDSGPASHPGHERYVIDLPDGWEVRLDEPLVVYANGLCLGAGLALYHQGAEDVRVELEPPYCRVAPDA